MSDRASKMPWRCFHCDEVFRDRNAAAEHFGTSLAQRPACLIDIAEYRRMEEVNRLHCEEDTQLHRKIYAAQRAGEALAANAEEVGYARGLADAKRHPAELGLVPVELAPQTMPAEECITLQEAWEAAGGHPGIKATREGLLEALRSPGEAKFGVAKARVVPPTGALPAADQFIHVDPEGAVAHVVAAQELLPLGDFDPEASGCVRWREGVTRATLSGETFHTGTQLRQVVMRAFALRHELLQCFGAEHSQVGPL